MKRALALITLVFALLGCETQGGLLFTYAAQGTQIQAERLVAAIYGQATKPLPYGSADIDQAFKRMQARWPSIKTELDHGSVGMTDNGELAIRTPGDQAPALRKLIRQENRDRQLLYRALGIAVGHGDESQLAWLGYTEDVFAQEWIAKADPAWWYKDAQQQWRQRKELVPVEVGK